MNRLNSSHIRRITICAAAALAIALPSIASAGVYDRAKSRAQGVKARAATVVSIVREKRPVANAIQNSAENLAVADLFEMVKELKLKAIKWRICEW